MQSEFRRKAPRRDFDGVVGALYRGQMNTTQCSQLGEGGALINSSAHLESIQKGDHILLTLFLPNIGGVVATAQCVYIADDKKIGLQFLEVQTSYKKKIREFVSRRKAIEVA